MWRINEAANRLGEQSKVSGNKLIINGESFGIDELDLVPCEILGAAKQEKKTGDGIAFRGEDSIFSNFHKAEIVVGGG